MSAREDDIVATFVAMSGSLATGHDVNELLTQLAAECARLLDVSAVGLLLADPRGALHVVAASSERVADLEASSSCPYFPAGLPAVTRSPQPRAVASVSPILIQDLVGSAKPGPSRWFSPRGDHAGVATGDEDCLVATRAGCDAHLDVVVPRPVA